MTGVLTNTKVQSDVEAYLEQPGRAELIRQVRDKINTSSIEYIYYQYVSITGRIMGKFSHSSVWETFAERGFQQVYTGLTNVAVDRHGNFIGYGLDTAEFIGVPDPETFCQLPWDKTVARVFSTCFRERYEDVEPGTYLTSDCRGNLKRIHEQFQQEHGLHLRHGCEPEMVWLRRGLDGKPEGIAKPNCYHIDQLEEMRPVYKKVIQYARAMGLDMIQGDYEVAPGQLELNFAYDDTVRTCDRLTTYRQICAQVAREFNLIACFMAKPFNKTTASSCHQNLSVWRSGEEIVKPLGNELLPGMDGVFTYYKGGENTFMPREGDPPTKPGVVGLQCIAGGIEHLGALTAIGCSTINSYRRLWDTGQWAPVNANYGFQNRTCSFRISAPGRLEYRTVDAMVNPYLMAAAMLKAFDHGIKDNLDPGEPEKGNTYESEVARRSKRLPTTLDEALNHLSDDEVIKSALPGDTADFK